MLGAGTGFAQHIAGPGERFPGMSVYTNNTGELSSFCAVSKLLFRDRGIREAKLLFDNTFAIGVIQGFFRYKGGETWAFEIRESWRRLQGKIRTALGHVYSHNSQFWNNCADYWANKGRAGLVRIGWLSTNGAWSLNSLGGSRNVRTSIPANNDLAFA